MSAAEVQKPPSKQAEPSLRQLSLQGHVGFDSLPDQLVNKSVAQGYSFNILCVGETGIGKSTLLDSLFNTRFDSTYSSHELPQVQLKSHTYDLQESNVKLKLTIVESCGFGDQIDKSDSWQPIVDYIDNQFEAYLQEELKIKRALHAFQDSRIHACIYFIAPTGHSLKSLDLVMMQKLQSKVNLIPVIAKSDTITKAELDKFKAKIVNELTSNGVKIYQFPVDDDTVAVTNAAMNGVLPFAVVGSSDEVKVGNKMAKARQYVWGTVQIENENHCDFVKLREMLIRTNMEDMRQVTHTIHYELYRQARLASMGFSDSDNVSVQETYEKNKAAMQAEMEARENAIRQSFVDRVKAKEAELKEEEKELHAKTEQIKTRHTEEKQRLDERKKQLDEDTARFVARKQAAIAQHTATLKTKKK